MSWRYSRLRLQAQLRPVRLACFYRLIHRQHAATPLGAVPAPSRFSDPNSQYAVLYASESIRCSFWEALARNRFTHRQQRELAYTDVEQRLIVTFCSTQTLSLLDLRQDGPVRIGAPTAVAHDARHQAGRKLSAELYAQVPDADGILYLSRFTGDACVAVFDRALTKLTVLSVASLIEYEEFFDALDDYGIILTTPPLN